MKNRTIRRICALVLGFWMTALIGCGEDEVGWEVARDTVGAVEGDRIQMDQQWRVYQESVVRSLDEMKTVLSGIRDQTGVDERGRVEGLISRVEQLRHDMIEEFDVPRDRVESARERLASGFVEVRSEVDAFLVQHDVDPMEMKKWADVE